MRSFSSSQVALIVALLRMQTHVFAYPCQFNVTQERRSNHTEFETSIDVAYDPEGDIETSIDVAYDPEGDSNSFTKIEFLIQAETQVAEMPGVWVSLAEKKQKLKHIKIGDKCCEPKHDLQLSSPRLLKVVYFNSSLFVVLWNNVSMKDFSCHAWAPLTRANLTLQAVIPKGSRGSFLVTLPCRGAKRQEPQDDRFFLPFLLVTSALLMALAAIAILAALLLYRTKLRPMGRHLLEEETSECTTPGRCEVRRGGGRGRAGVGGRVVVVGGGGKEAVEAEVCSEGTWWEAVTCRASGGSSAREQNHHEAQDLMRKPRKQESPVIRR